MDGQSQEQEQRRQGNLIDSLNNLYQTGNNIKAAINLSRIGARLAEQTAARAAGAAVSNPIVWIIVGIIILVLIVVIILLTSTIGSASDLGGETSQNGGGPGSSSVNIASCTFYRGGDSISGVKFGNPALANFVTETAAKVGVPPAILAGIMRVETGERLVDPNPIYFDTDYDSHTSGVAYGLMQFTPGTFTNTFNVNKDELQRLFSKTNVEEALKFRNEMSPSNILRIYSIRDSIIAAAFKVRNDKQTINGDGPWNEATIREIARRYYGTSQDYAPGQNYGSDLWKSYSNCTAVPTIANASSCPIPRGTVTCGSKFTPVNGCGHCGIGYGEENISMNCNNPAYTAINYAIDIGGNAGSPVYLPQINGHAVKWTWGTEGKTNSGWIQKYAGTDEVNQDKYYIEFHHTVSGSGNPGTHLSGEVGATICGDCNVTPHAHVELGSGNSFGSNNLDAALYLCRR